MRVWELRVAENNLREILQLSARLAISRGPNRQVRNEFNIARLIVELCERRLTEEQEQQVRPQMKWDLTAAVKLACTGRQAAKQTGR